VNRVAETLRPLGGFAPTGPDDDWSARRLVGGRLLEEPIRSAVVRYMNYAPIFYDWMEYTFDQLEGKFSVPGGSGIRCDGVVYWRVDAAHYVETYGFAVPRDFVSRGRGMSWVPPVLDAGERQEVFEKLNAILLW
jgi:hypothetical protein